MLTCTPTLTQSGRKMNKYPAIVYANVLLLNDRIINWKTGSTDWSNDRWMSSRQPLHHVREAAPPYGTGIKELRVEQMKFLAHNVDEWNAAFSKAIEFYKMFEMRSDIAVSAPY